MLEQLVHLIKQEQAEIARSNVLHPNPDNYMLMAGKYQGLQTALDLMDQLLQENVDD